MKHKPLKYPKTRKQLAKQIARLAEHMIDIGTTLEVMAGFDVDRAANGRLLVDVGLLYAEIAKDERK